MRKKLTALVLALALAVSLLIVPAGAVGTFPDLAGLSAQDREPVEVLYQLGVVNGLPNGTFNPGGAFTRAEFCKMALVILGREGEAALQQSRVIFTDVTARHWALGFVNAASQSPEGGVPLVQGVGDGRFLPDTPITYGSAVAILMRCLGYSDADVGSAGSAWYAGYLSRAKEIGLLDGIAGLTGDGTLTRLQAARLFQNLLFVCPKGSRDIFLSAQLGGEVTESQLLLEVGKPLSAGGYAVHTQQGTHRTFRNDLSDALQGQRVKLVLDGDGDVLALLPDGDFTTRTVRILSAEARYAVIEGQEQVLIPAATPVWQTDGTETTYGDVYKRVGYGTGAILCYDKTDTLLSLYLMSGTDASQLTAVAGAGPDPFGSILGSAAGVTVYKDGAAATLADAKEYDVGVYDPHTGVLNLYDRKLTGAYENAVPSAVSPETIVLMGHEFRVLECALKDLSKFSLGDAITLLLDGENRVAGVVSAQECPAQAIGVASIEPGGPDDNGRPTYTATVRLALGFEVEGTVRSTALGAQQAPGKLVGVSSAAKGSLTLTELEGEAVPGGWNVAAGKVGSWTLAGNAALHDQVGNGPLLPVRLSEIAQTTLSSDRIRFVHRNAAGQVDAMVLDNVTGDAFVYGILSTGTVESSGITGLTSKNPSVTVKNGGTSLTLITSQDHTSKKGQFVGLAPSVDHLGDYAKLSRLVTLQSLSVRRSAFEEGSVTVNGVTYPLASNIDQCCYNASAGEWFASLDEALAYTSRLTLYYDRAPSQGGKIRLVVAA